MDQSNIDFVLKVVVCGQEAAGKTSLVRRFAEEHFSIDEAPTLGVGLYIRNVAATKSGRVFKLQMWDTSGKPRFASVSAGWFQGAAVYVFVYNTCSRQSFDTLDSWLTQSKWGHQLNTKAMGLLVGTQVDRSTYREVEREQGESFAATHSLLFFETSALTAEGVASVFQSVADTMDGVCRELTFQEAALLMPTEDEEETFKFAPLIIQEPKGNEKKCCCCILL
jgi:small GTP-binding protein